MWGGVEQSTNPQKEADTEAKNSTQDEANQNNLTSVNVANLSKETKSLNANDVNSKLKAQKDSQGAKDKSETITAGESTEKTVTRDIYLQLEGQDKQFYRTESVTLQRTGVKNTAGEITWNAWQTATMEAVTAPDLANYIVQNLNAGIAVTVDGSQDKLADVVFQYRAVPDIYNENHIVTRTVNVSNPITGQTYTLTTQPATITRKVYKNQASGETTYGNWSTATIEAVTAPEYPGYTVDNPDAAGALVVNSDQVKDSTITFTYSANDQEQLINYIDKNDHSNIVGTQPIYGKTYETVNWTPQVPENWALAPNQTISSTITFGTSEKDPIVLYVEHGAQHILYQTKTVTRTVNYIDPTDPTQESTKSITTQQVTLNRTGYKNGANGDTVYTDWSTGIFEAVKAKQIAGYTVTNPDAAPEMKVTGNTKNSSVTFRYTANEQSFNVNYVDDSTRKVVNTVPVSGKTDETVSFDAQAHVPSGYVIVSGQNIPSSFHITGDKMDDVDILVHHNYNEKYHVSLPAGEQITTHVGANENVSSLDPSKIALNWTDENGNSISEPEGTQVTWATVPDTTKIANETGNLNIKFRDGTTTSIEIPVVVQGATAGDVQKVYQNDPVPAASGSVNTSTVDHFGISSDAWSVAPSTAILGMASGTVRVNYSDGTYQDVDVYIDVIDRPKVSIPAGEQVTTHVGARADAQIMSPSLDPSNIQLTWTGAKGETIQLPAGITVVWETVPDTTKIANETGILNVKFANGSITRLGIPVIVKGAKQGEVQTVYVGDPVPSAKKAVDTTDVKNYFDISSVKWLATDTPSTAAVGNNIPGTVRVTYSDGTYQDVVVAINVISKGGGTPTTIPWTKIDPQPKPKPKPDPTPDKKPDKDDQPKQPEQKPEVEKHDGKTNKVTEKTVVQKVVKKSASASVTGKVNKPVAKQAAQKVALPQTGEKDSNLATILGSLVALVGLSVLAYADKKKRN